MSNGLLLAAGAYALTVSTMFLNSFLLGDNTLSTKLAAIILLTLGTLCIYLWGDEQK